MKLSIKTVVLQEMVTRAIKGAGQNKLIPLTSLMAINVANNTIRLVTTDASNTLYIQKEIQSAEDFNCVVNAEQFYKLISKLTSENVILSVEDSVLSVKANGTYKLELPLDENGEAINYPDPVAETNIDDVEAQQIKLADIKTILNTNKASLAVTMDMPVYTGYYIGDKVVTTDTYKICGYDKKLLKENVLVARETMDLLDVMTEDTVDVYVKHNVLEFVTKDCTVFAYSMYNEIDDFSIEAINELLNAKFKQACKVNKTDLLSLLDRISLFVDTYDNKAITLTFTEKGLEVSSKQANGVETIPYIEAGKVKPYSCSIDITLLSQQVKANISDTVEIQYGSDSSIKLVDDNITQVIALIEDSEK